MCFNPVQGDCYFHFFSKSILYINILYSQTSTAKNGEMGRPLRNKACVNLRKLTATVQREPSHHTAIAPTANHHKRGPHVEHRNFQQQIEYGFKLYPGYTLINIVVPGQFSPVHAFVPQKAHQFKV